MHIPNYFFLNKRASVSIYNTHLDDMHSSDGKDAALAAYWSTDINGQYKVNLKYLYDGIRVLSKSNYHTIFILGLVAVYIAMSVIVIELTSSFRASFTG